MEIPNSQGGRSPAGLDDDVANRGLRVGSRTRYMLIEPTVGGRLGEAGGDHEGVGEHAVVRNDSVA